MHKANKSKQRSGGSLGSKTRRGLPSQPTDLAAHHTPDDFRKLADAVLLPLQNAFARVISAVPDPIDRSFDLQRVLNLDTKLAWQIYKFTNSADVFPASVMLPGMLPIERFLAAAMRCGVDPNLCASVMERFKAFESFVHHRAGDRATFNSIVSADGVGGSAVDLFHQKNMFRGAAHFLGVQSAVQVISYIFYPSSTTAGGWDLMTITYKIGVQRLRPDVNIRLARIFRVGSPSHAQASPSATRSWFEPIESRPPDAAESPIPNLLAPFCSEGAAELLIVREHENHLWIELAAGGVGAAGRTDWAFGIVERNVAEAPTAGALLSLNSNNHSAVESVVFDYYYHNSAPAPKTSVKVYSGHHYAELGDRVDEPLRSLAVTVLPKGPGLSQAGIDQAPRYPDLIQHCCNQLGWDVQSLNLHRSQVHYPLFGSSMEIQFQF